ncbi:hypothetical protein [Spirochaeta isovalerica]|uniref:Rubrerythrin n=1 Tax=Spirochaeta isovalerica TaxID=150 RepID=A0A841RHD6_9SPIO|nr:hypothetical protein [Spirochaeta isovalerica]MBB6482597.1 rubrerythrin [Spirochaeta isovalerica]
MTEEVFLVKLAKGLEQYRVKLESSAIPKMKQSASVLHSSYKNLYQFCLDKKLLSVDQYSDESAVKELKAPSSDPFIESERQVELNIRFAAYNKQLEYLNTSFSFNIENFDLATVKQLSDLISYIDWTSFSENSGKHMTRAFAVMLGTLRLGSDAMQVKVIKNDLKRLREETQNFKEALQDIALLRKEQYKSELRKRIAFDGVIDYKEDTKEDIEKNIRHMMKREMEGVPFYSQLINQLIDDEMKAPASWEELLKKLSPEEKKTVTTKGLDKNELLIIIKELGKTSLLLNKILKKFDENGILINRKKRNFIEKIAFALSEAFNKNKKIFYDIEVYNAEHTVKKAVHMNYTHFAEELKANAHKIYMLSTPESLKKLSEMDDEDILIKINTSMDVFKRSFRKLSALDDFFKEKSPKHVKSEISGVKVELNGIKMSLTTAQKRRNEYLSQKEEIEQLKKLGIHIEQT